MNILSYGIPRRIYHYMFSLSNCLTLFDVISLLALRLYIYSNTAFKQYTVQLYYVWSYITHKYAVGIDIIFSYITKYTLDWYMGMSVHFATYSLNDTDR